MTSQGTLRILIAKAGLDGHDRGAKVLASLLREAGFEVIYLGMYNTPEMIVNSAVQEDADLIGVSFLSGEHLSLTAKLMAELRRQGAEDIPVILGGIMPPEDTEALLAMGVKKVFRGALVGEVAGYLKEHVTARRGNRTAE
ncbi:MAG: cobalamin B12-binding domain-containing protein [Proteobacteria bacterium]|nr:cobalamin B12-binding domain-containing protein [Pseudomonadota bacterium]